MPVAQTLSEGRSIRFGPFELNLHTAELSKNGLKLKLQGQPVKVLALLLEKPGQLISREEIRQHLWPADTFVDFEHNLNTDIKRLREVLGDEADMPRYIETLRGRGYRFIGEIERDNPPQGVPAPTVGVVSPLALANETEQEAGKRSRLWKWSPVALGLLILGTVAATYIFNPPSTLRIVATRRLTRTPFNKGDTGGRYSAIVTDGARIYFRENRAGRWGISEVSTMGG